MNRIGQVILVSATLLVAGVALASGPTPNSAILNLRVFNDCPTSILTTVNNYPSEITISDAELSCGGFANLHNWRFSEDGSTAIQFPNDSAFRFSFDLVIEGTSEGEAGLSLSPWWSPDVDGRVNCRTTDGEIAVFGGRLPFYSFTANHAVNYTKGTMIRLQITYYANSLTMADPGTAQYELTYGGTTYSSPVLPFDEGNPAEPYGVWGILDDAQAGGYVQPFLQGGNPAANLSAHFTNIVFEQLKPVSVEQDSWGSVKALYR